MKKFNFDDIIEKKINEIISQLTVEEKCSLMKYDSPAIERLGIPAYNWWNEGLHGLARAGTATMFPQAIAMAASFDNELIQKAGDIIASEARAKYNENIKHNDYDIYKGLTLWSPNINIFRDPRWGRGQETYGECPYLTSVMADSFVKGIQGENTEFLKASACVKHLAVHSGPEESRHGFNAEVSLKDLYETYLPAFEKLICNTGVSGVMGAYNMVNGEPCCGSSYFNELLRNKWNFKGYFVSDCWAIADFHNSHHITATAVESAALAIKNGCDLNCGVTYIYAMQAYNDGLIDENDIDNSVRRLLKIRMLLDTLGDNYKNPCKENPYKNISYEIVDCDEHNALSAKMAAESMVLLKNDGILPLDRKSIKKIAVIGSGADSRTVLKGNYCGTASENITFLEGIRREFKDYGKIFYSEGCHLFKEQVEPLALPDDRISEAVTIAKLCDVTILCLGFDSTIEGEQGDTGNAYASGDRLNLLLPDSQRRLLKAIEKTGKPFIIVLSSGGAVNTESEKASALIQTWYPGAYGGSVLAKILFGDISPSGKLPVTFYKDSGLLPDFSNYSMKNRTYRYAENNVLYPFGYGLTYSSVKCTSLDVIYADRQKGIKVRVAVTNTGNYDTDDVIQIYIKDNISELAVRNYSLCAFRRIHLKKSESLVTELKIESYFLEVVGNDGKRFIDSNNFTVYAGLNQPDDISSAMTGNKCLNADILL